MFFFPWVLPSLCLLCGAERGAISAPICRRCRRAARRAGFVPPFGPELEGAFACYQFERGAREAVLRFKYGRRFYLARSLGRWFGRRPPFQAAVDAIVPVPMASLRRWRRGYNPALLLAAELSCRWRIPLESNWIRRRWGSVSQTSLGRQARERNARRAYRAVVTKLPALTVLLVDDVITTGATLRACARVLRRAGVARVWAVALAYDRIEDSESSSLL